MLAGATASPAHRGPTPAARPRGDCVVLDYAFTCEICDSPVAAGVDACPRCGCPAEKSPATARRYREAWVTSDRSRPRSRAGVGRRPGFSRVSLAIWTAADPARAAHDVLASGGRGPGVPGPLPVFPAQLRDPDQRRPQLAATEGVDSRRGLHRDGNGGAGGGVLRSRPHADARRGARHRREAGRHRQRSDVDRPQAVLHAAQQVVAGRDREVCK